MADLSRFAVHTQTFRPWSLQQCVDRFAGAGFGGISVWRHTFDEMGIDAAAKLVRASGLKVPALVRGGFFPASDDAARAAAIDDNRRCIDEAAALGAESVVLVVGAVPGMPLATAREQVRDGIAALLPHAEAVGVKLAIEPLHPMYAADKSCINRIAEAREVCDALEHPLVGVAVDVYHVWWDPDLDSEVERLGASDRLFGYHVCDWRVDTRHLLTDRGLMGEGCIDLAGIGAMVTRAGFDGLAEVEVFSEHHWSRDQADWLADVVAACTAM